MHHRKGSTPSHKFQSAPRSEERGDAKTKDTLERWNTFQSAPRSEERGDELADNAASPLNQFQSAPRSEERGDMPGSVPAPTSSCFNPRPAPRSGAICL